MHEVSLKVTSNVQKGPKLGSQSNWVLKWDPNGVWKSSQRVKNKRVSQEDSVSLESKIRNQKGLYSKKPHNPKIKSPDEVFRGVWKALKTKK